MDEKKYQRIIKQIKAVERAHCNCKRERLTRAIRELERLRDNEDITLSRTGYIYIEERLEKLNSKLKRSRYHGRL